MQSSNCANSLNGLGSDAIGEQSPLLCGAVTLNLDSELMPKADPLDFVNTDCRLFFSLSKIKGTQVKSGFYLLIKYSHSLLMQDTVHVYYHNFHCYCCSYLWGKNTPLKYTFQMAVFKMGLQRPNEDECFTSSVSMALPHCWVTRGRNVWGGRVSTKLHFR